MTQLLALMLWTHSAPPYMYIHAHVTHDVTVTITWRHFPNLVDETAKPSKHHIRSRQCSDDVTHSPVTAQ